MKGPPGGLAEWTLRLTPRAFAVLGGDEYRAAVNAGVYSFGIYLDVQDCGTNGIVMEYETPEGAGFSLTCHWLAGSFNKQYRLLFSTRSPADMQFAVSDLLNMDSGFRSFSNLAWPILAPAPARTLQNSPVDHWE